MSIKTPSRCKKNEILRKGYTRKSYVRKSGVNVKESLIAPGCIIKRGKSLRINGKPATQIIINSDDHSLSEYGYYDIENKTDDERKHSLHKLIKHFIPKKGDMETYNYVIKALNARYILSKNTNPKVARIFKRDQKMISNEYKKYKITMKK